MRPQAPAQGPAFLSFLGSQQWKSFQPEKCQIICQIAKNQVLLETCEDEAWETQMQTVLHCREEKDGSERSMNTA